jgi:Cse1
MLPDFVNTTWTLLTTTGLESKYDIVTSPLTLLMEARQQSNGSFNICR